MALETVKITALSDDIIPVTVDGIVVRVFDATGTALITEGTTGTVTAGVIEFSLPGTAAPTPTTYQLRFYINGGTIIPSPQYIDVFSPPSGSPTGTNNFQITATLFVLPTSPNPRLCRVSGFIWDPAGRPRRGIDIAFIPCFRPLVVDGIGILGERVNTKTDKNGYVQVDLLRNGLYQATVESHENVEREVAVPDRSSINVMHLLFPIVVKVEYDPVGPFSMLVGDDLVLTPTVTASDFRELSGAAPEDVLYSTDDPTIAAVLVSTKNITIHAVSAGTTNLVAKRKDGSVVYVPDPGISGASVAITVS